MSVFEKKGSPFYHFDFQYRGKRFHGSTCCTNRRAAEAVERDKREQARREALTAPAASGVGSLQIDHVADRYWEEKGKYHAGADNTDRDLARLVGYFGKAKLLAEIDDNDVARLVAWRRSQRSAPHKLPKGKRREDYPFITPATVNRSTTEVLKKLFTHARTVWKVRFDNEPTWKVHMLREPVERVRELIGDEGARLEAAMRDDYSAFFEFVHATGLRKEECVTLRWSEVNWQARQIVRLGKNDRRVTAPITDHVRAILESLMGHHAEFVFTYVAVRTVRTRGVGETLARTGNRKDRGELYTAKRGQEERIKGRRYPMTLSGVSTAWKRLRKRAGVKDFRLHDFRHDLATKVLRQTGNLKLVSRMLNHADLKTTMRYAHVLDEDVAAAMESFHGKAGAQAPMQDHDTESRNKSRTRRLKAI
ncbi:MAG TPA: tyrosine-type recombinase/integrase [Rhizomicrobium sp.]|jgi:integrase|nr:tyrosine-type recombinase/integrase [Rhizomicrobium sp.]